MSGQSAETAEIKNEIERTRVEMSETIGEIQERLRPEHLIQQAKTTVTDAATGKVRTMMDSASETATVVADQTRYASRNVVDYARLHPVQMGLLAGGLTWWMLRRGDGYSYSDEWTGASEGWHEHEGYAAYDEERSLRDRAGEYVSGARETVGEYADTARRSAQQATERVRSAADTARIRARERWQRTSTTVDDWVHENPLAAGAVAVAIGAAIGLSVPSSRWEDRTLGRTRDQAWDKASRAVREMKDDVAQKASKVADTVMDVTTGSTAGTGTSRGSGAGSVGVSGTSTSTVRGTGEL
jgi:ElaB/YqjD/DUF883 family membrane-anchored ribosome-binding protein